MRSAIAAVALSAGCQLAVGIEDVSPAGDVGLDLEQVAFLKSSNGEAGDQLGLSVAVDGDILAVAAPGEASDSRGVNPGEDNLAPLSGAVYAFVRDGDAWVQEAFIKASNTEAEDFFGISIALSGDTLAVGASGEDSTATGTTGDDQALNGAPESGAVYVFVRAPNGTWSQQAYIKPSNTGDNDEFGRQVDLDGDTLVVGASFEDSGARGVNGDGANDDASDSGAAYVFFRSGTSWLEQAYLKASNADAGDRFGNHVAVSGDTVVVGAPVESSAAAGVGSNGNDNSAVAAGAAYVFVRSGSSWSEQAYLKPSTPGAMDLFGAAVDVDGDTVAVTAFGEDGASTGVDGDEASDAATDAGAAYVFFRDGQIWSQQGYIKAINAEAGDNFGHRAVVDGDRLAVAALNEDGGGVGLDADPDDNSASDAGAVYLYSRVGGAWSPELYVKGSNTEAGDLFGEGLDLAGPMACGSSRESSPPDGAESDNGSANTGAAYVFE